MGSFGGAAGSGVGEEGRSRRRQPKAAGPLASLVDPRYALLTAAARGTQLGRETSVYIQARSSDEAGFRAGQIYNQCRDFFGSPITAQCQKPL